MFNWKYSISWCAQIQRAEKKRKVLKEVINALVFFSIIEVGEMQRNQKMNVTNLFNVTEAY